MPECSLVARNQIERICYKVVLEPTAYIKRSRWHRILMPRLHGSVRSKICLLLRLPRRLFIGTFPSTPSILIVGTRNAFWFKFLIGCSYSIDKTVHFLKFVAAMVIGQCCMEAASDLPSNLKYAAKIAIPLTDKSLFLWFTPPYESRVDWPLNQYAWDISKVLFKRIDEL